MFFLVDKEMATAAVPYHVSFQNRRAGLNAAGGSGSNPPPGGDGSRQPPEDRPPIFDLTDEERRELEEERALQELENKYEERTTVTELHPHESNLPW